MPDTNSAFNLLRPFGASKSALLLSLFKILVKSKNHYVVPSVLSLGDLLDKYHNIRIKRRWIFYCLAWLIREGYLKRRRRWKHTDDNTILSYPGMLVLTLKGIAYLRSKSVEGARDLYKKMISWINRNDNRFPRPEDIKPPETYLSPAENLLRFKKIIEGFT